MAPLARLAQLRSQLRSPLPDGDGSAAPSPSPSGPSPAPAAGKDGVVRWGIMGTANIANTLLGAIRDAPNAETLGIASRSIESVRPLPPCSAHTPRPPLALRPGASQATKWGEERGIPKAYGSYQEMLEDDEIDAVYVPLPTSLHL